jgi:hypothetical protein
MAASPAVSAYRDTAEYYAFMLAERLASQAEHF